MANAPEWPHTDNITVIVARLLLAQSLGSEDFETRLEKFCDDVRDAYHQECAQLDALTENDDEDPDDTEDDPV
jgi:hypothetical protein